MSQNKTWKLKGSLRQVGVCLKHLPSPSEDKPYHSGNVPWQRVINSKGGISPRLVLYCDIIVAGEFVDSAKEVLAEPVAMLKH